MHAERTCRARRPCTDAASSGSAAVRSCQTGRMQRKQSIADCSARRPYERNEAAFGRDLQGSAEKSPTHPRHTSVLITGAAMTELAVGSPGRSRTPSRAPPPKSSVDTARPLTTRR
eukprot:364510-Chlamydomonas_euryale.AAC.12